MTDLQENILLEFLINVADAFSIDDVAAFIRLIDSSGRIKRFKEEITAFINAGNLAFHLGKNMYISRRGCFESACFVINPSRLEIMNGILVPGHRCVPFANPEVLPKDYTFYWQGEPIPESTTEGAPEDFYQYYALFGEEYAPHYIARESPENESAFISSLDEDPSEVSIKTLDMSAVFRTSGFVPGDVFVVKTLNWVEAVFELERVSRSSWSTCELYAWAEEAEAAFREVFSIHGACNSIEEQISYAYWYGRKRMRDVPSYALDDFLYNQTEQIDTVPYGMETRLWFAGKDIPDLEDLRANQGPPDRTPIEEALYAQGVPISEYVIHSYVKDALFRNEKNINAIADCVVPPSVDIPSDLRKGLVSYINEAYRNFSNSYTLFVDKETGPIRKRLCELHTAIIEYAARIKKADIDRSWFPKHTFIIFAQIQENIAGILEDIDIGGVSEAADLEAVDWSLDNMLESYEEMKLLIEQSIETYRRYKLSIVRDPKTALASGEWLTFQASLGGTDVWRRFIIPAGLNLYDLHRVIQIVFEWKESFSYRFILDESFEDKKLNEPLIYQSINVKTLHSKGKMEFIYEYGSHWTVTLMCFLNNAEIPAAENYCIAGAGAAPSENIEGPMQFRRYAYPMKKGIGHERKIDLHTVDMNDINRKLSGFLQRWCKVQKKDA